MKLLTVTTTCTAAVTETWQLRITDEQEAALAADPELVLGLLDQGEPVSCEDEVSGEEDRQVVRYEVTNEPPERPDPDITVIVTRSGGPDGAVLVFIDTTFLPVPDGTEDTPGLRIRVNDEPVFEGKAYQSPEDPEGVGVQNPHRELHVRLTEITPQ